MATTTGGAPTPPDVAGVRDTMDTQARCPHTRRQCIFLDTTLTPHGRCPKEATYIVVESGSRLPRVPMAVDYHDNYYAHVPRGRQIGALYCRLHAYVVCGLT